MKSDPTKVNSKTDFTGVRFYPNPQIARGSSPMLSTAIHSSSGRKETEQRRVQVLPQLILGPAQTDVLSTPLQQRWQAWL